MSIIKVKMSFIGLQNQVCQFLNELDDKGIEIPRQMQVFDVKSEMVLSRLRSIATRALKIDDAEILDDLLTLGIVYDDKVSDVDLINPANFPIKVDENCKEPYFACENCGGSGTLDLECNFAELKCKCDFCNGTGKKE